MTEAYDESGMQFTLDTRLASGGQGVVWKLAGNDAYLAKIYHAAPSTRESAKHRLLRAKADSLKAVAALPLSIAFRDRRLTSPIGIFIPFVEGKEVFELFGTASRLQHFPRANFKFLIRVAYNIAAAFEELHAQGIVIGDVNEQNIKTLPDATVRLIDCDSFQIADGATIHTSDVGTPLWTAPELHGSNLTGLVRTQNHDLFGLAQLIFLLLFTGRYPFAGVPRTQKALLPEEAIQQHAFAFAPSEMNLPLGPPPGSPKFQMLPPALRDGFKRAFLKESVHANARPKAAQWRVMLDMLSKELVTCAHNSSHYFWIGSVDCPWCQIIREVGVDLFPASQTNIPDLSRQFQNNDGYVLRLAGIRPYQFAITRAPAFTDLRPSSLPPVPTGFWSSLNRLFSAQGWKQSWLGPSIRKNRQTMQQNEARLTSLNSQQQAFISNYTRDFATISGPLNGIVKSLKNTSELRNSCLQSVKDERRQESLNKHLQKFYIRNTRIHQIGPSRLATLSSFGIETAANITSKSLNAAGMPTNASVELLNWRKEKEATFQFDPSQAITAVQAAEARARLNSRVKKLREDAAAIEIKLNEATQKTREKLRPLEAQIHQVAREMEQAKIDVATLERELAKP